jgi:lysophospholipase L1-like esterase
LFADWFEKNQFRNIAFGHTRGMKEWAVANNLTKDDGIHPNAQGHDQLTQQYILPWVNKHLIQC